MSKQKLSPLGLAMEADDADAVERFVRANPDALNMQTGVGTLIHYAATKCALHTVQRLVSLGFDVNTPSYPPDGEPPEGPLSNAVSGGSIEVVRWLLEQGAKSDCFVPSEGITRNFALHEAIDQNRLDLVQLLVEYGANVNVYYSDRTPLLIAEALRHKEIAKYLRSKGAKTPEELGQGKPAQKPPTSETKRKKK